MSKLIHFIDYPSIDGNLLKELGISPEDTIACSEETRYDEGAYDNLIIVPGFRSNLFRDEFMEHYNAFIDKMRGSGGRRERQIVGYHLLEVMRYQLLFDLDEVFYKVWGLKQLIRISAPEKVIFHSSLKKVLFHTGIRKFSFQLEDISVSFRLKPKHKALNPIFQKLRTTVGLAKYFKGFLGKGKIGNNIASCDVLFVENSPKSSLISIDLARFLEENNDFKTQVVAVNEEVHSRAEKNGIENILPYKGLLKRKELFKALRKYTNPSSHYDLLLKEFFQDDYLNLAKKLIYRDFKNTVSNNAAQALFNSYIARRVLRWSNAKAIFSTSGGSLYARSFFIQGNRSGLRTCLLQHGYYIFDPFDKYIVNNTMFVWGDMFRDKILNAGSGNTEVVVCGYSRLNESFRKYKNSGKPRSEDKVRVLYLAPKTGGNAVSVVAAKQYLQIIKDGLDLAGNDFHLQIKAHPYDRNLDIFDGLELFTDENIYGLMAEADIVISAASTTALYEAAAFDKLLILIDNNDIPVELRPEIIEHDPAPIIGNAEFLASFLRQIKSKGLDLKKIEAKRREFARACFDDLDRVPNKRIAEYLTPYIR